ncbi:hypothetical protein VB715_20780 [Crocosphaera sp. UHCC 0190]|uniref:hypothetical protein n=1 Tax=Crocosphaera sp. UHCC 0190 TaxID=3110246 RepID=UPI002B1E9A8F|nr:hypothetical protein [Crocosphaera sp. UHCC 0190]MEA5512212.1 hypothetical protein [Crocosphaera sp. UHCC 0190]
MTINSTIKLTVLLLLVMSGAGTASAYFAYHAGHAALRGVSQPDINPTKKLTDAPKTSTEPTEFKPVDEKTILVKVYDHVHNKEKSPAQGDSEKKPEKEVKKEEKETSQSLENQDKQENPTQLAADFPLKTEDKGVKLEVNEATNQGTTLSLKVNLKNEGTKPVKFLYSFLEVKDAQGNAMSAITEGLPEELPPNSENFVGMIKIPIALVGKSPTLSLNLTDYPDQKLKLSLAQIPVVR